MRTLSRKLAVLGLVALGLLGQQFAMAAGVTVSAISGTVLSAGGNPIPALVFVNGKSKSADKNTGAFTLGPLASLTVDQTLTLRVFAPGYAPVSKALVVPSLPPRQFSVAINTGRITMQRVAPGKALTIKPLTFKEGAERGSFEVSGTVKDGTTPVPALVCATGAVLACQTTDAVGKFIRRGKLSATGKVTLQVFPFSKAYQPYKFITPDTDKDGTADFMDRDDDDDGFVDGLDDCPLDPNPACNKKDTDGDGTPDYLDKDDDNDRILDVNDECKLEVGGGADFDKDGCSNAKDIDDDNDGLRDGQDKCPLDINPLCSMKDTDGDRTPDYLDTDDDGDGILDVNDQCKLDTVISSGDYDKDGCSNDRDQDDDNDRILDVVDECPFNSNTACSTLDTDRDGTPDYLDTDDDGDGIADGADLCPTDAFNSSGDTDRDGCSNDRDIDDDGDGLQDAFDDCPRNSAPCKVITDVKVVNGRTWAQPDLFKGITTSQIFAGCPVVVPSTGYRVCNDAVFNGWSLNGWELATYDFARSQLFFGTTCSSPGFTFRPLRVSSTANFRYWNGTVFSGPEHTSLASLYFWCSIGAVFVPPPTGVAESFGLWIYKR